MLSVTMEEMIQSNRQQGLSGPKHNTGEISNWLSKNNHK